jgi:hypothetical protein
VEESIFKNCAQDILQVVMQQGLHAGLTVHTRGTKTTTPLSAPSAADLTFNTSSETPKS